MGRNLHRSLIFASEESARPISALRLLRLHSDGRIQAFPGGVLRPLFPPFLPFGQPRLSAETGNSWVSQSERARPSGEYAVRSTARRRNAGHTHLAIALIERRLKDAPFLRSNTKSNGA